MSPKDNNKQVSAAVRILHQKRDASARATHLMVKNDSLITYEKAISDQAVVKKFFAATFLERKKMSTKTSFKRIALVAAAALAIGGFSAVPAKAASSDLPFYVSAADSGVQTTSTVSATKSATGVAGPLNFVSITADSALGSGEVLGITAAGVNGTLSVPTGPTNKTDTLTVSGNTITSTNNNISGAVVKILTPTAGTFTVTVSKIVTNNATGAVTQTTLQTFTFTINAASLVGAFSATNSFTVLRETTTAAITTNFELVAEYDTTTSALTVSTASSTTGDVKGTTNVNTAEKYIAVRLLDTQASPAALAGKTVTAVVTGVGLVAGTGSLTDTSTAWGNPAPAGTSKTNNAGWAFFAVYSYGTAGTGTVEITYTDAAGVKNVVGSESLVFTGSIATLTATQKAKVLRAGSATGATTDTGYAVQLVGKDSAGNIVDISGLTIAGKSSKSTVIADTSGSGVGAAGTLVPFARNLTVTGASTAVTGDAATVTWSYTDAAGVVISTAAVPFTVGGTSATSVAASFDQTEYAIGDLVTMTLTVKDSKSNSVADGSYFLFDTTTGNAFTTSAQLTSAPFGTGVVSVVGGVATATFYAPYTTGEFKMTAKMTSHSTVATAAQATSITASTNIGGADSTASLALDAANAATDAANNAYDEAQNATQAASDALAAVTALAKQVNSLIASVKKLTAAVAKLKR